MPDLNDIWEACNDLDEKLASSSKEASTESIRKHLQLIDSKLTYKIPDFESGLEWMNVSETLSLQKQLKGKIVVLDFFTYCCINCMHILPDLEALEEQFSARDGVVVIGVHSAKFENEKVSANILSAILRYNIHHPVVNDKNATLWSELQIACWPTLLILGPEGQFLYQLVGEGHKEKLIDFVTAARQFYAEQGRLTGQELPAKLEQLPPTPLSFPGKVCIGETGDCVVISDTGHHRMVITDQNGLVKTVIGGQEKGFKDGSFSEAQFSSPQGVCLEGSNLYIADTDNHAIRKADLDTKQVVTLAGTGCQGNDKEGGKHGTSQELSSPWDLCFADGLGGEKKAVMFIAMAGTHQIWVYFLKDAMWLKSKQYTAGTCVRFAGSGEEENRNNSYPEKASFAQPSGITVSRKHNCLFVADSESSSIRSVQLKDGAVKNIVGGDIDPKNLFAYGDIDGSGNVVRLQHPLGVAMATEDGPLLVADSYNHKIKSIDIVKRSCHTLLGTGKPGSSKGSGLSNCELSEPSGLACDWRKKKVYIADTNNHDIKVLDLVSQQLFSLPILFPSELQGETDFTDDSRSESQRGMEDQGQVNNVWLTVKPAEGVHLNEEAPNTWTLCSEDENVQRFLTDSKAKLKGGLTPESKQKIATLPCYALSGELCLKLDLYVCEDSGVCRTDKQMLKQTIGSQVKDVTFELELK